MYMGKNFLIANRFFVKDKGITRANGWKIRLDKFR